MKRASMVLIALSVVGFAAVAGAQTPQDACRHIKAKDCYGSMQCAKQKRDYAKCVEDHARNMGEQNGKPDTPPKAKK